MSRLTADLQVTHAPWISRIELSDYLEDQASLRPDFVASIERGKADFGNSGKCIVSHSFRFCARRFASSNRLVVDAAFWGGVSS
ncbi:MAG TPA: hypothetical protein VJ063_11390, partial [Verrucomicrobiae bacterium]|nr:hypothetical protein [Verrucomicrobiae bacterium]